MKQIEVPKIVVLIVVGTAALVFIIGVLSLVIAMLCKIAIEPQILVTVVQATSGAGGLLGGMLIKTKPETDATTGST